MFSDKNETFIGNNWKFSDKNFMFSDKNEKFSSNNWRFRSKNERLNIDN